MIILKDVRIVFIKIINKYIVWIVAKVIIIIKHVKNVKIVN